MNGSKTMKQLANELHVSKQAIWQRVKRSAELSAMLNDHTKTVNGTVYIDDVLEQRIKERYPNQNVSETIDKTNINVDETIVNNDRAVDETNINVDVNKLIITLQSTINTLQKQLTIKDKQIDELTTMLKTSQEQQATLVTALSAAQALHAGTIQERLTERSGCSEEQSEDNVVSDTSFVSETKRKRGFFSRLFGKKIDS